MRNLRNGRYTIPYSDIRTGKDRNIKEAISNLWQIIKEFVTTWTTKDTLGTTKNIVYKETTLIDTLSLKRRFFNSLIKT